LSGGWTERRHSQDFGGLYPTRLRIAGIDSLSENATAGAPRRGGTRVSPARPWDGTAGVIRAGEVP
jgi:hypothetical protein